MSREEALVALESASKLDTEEAHISADEVLCDLLKTLGYADVVNAWDKIDKSYVNKWYV